MPAIDLLKMDIERDEAVLFRHRRSSGCVGRGTTSSSSTTRSARALGDEALSGFEAERLRSGGLTVFLGLCLARRLDARWTQAWRRGFRRSWGHQLRRFGASPPAWLRGRRG